MSDGCDPAIGVVSKTDLVAVAITNPSHLAGVNPVSSAVAKQQITGRHTRRAIIDQDKIVERVVGDKGYSRTVLRGEDGSPRRPLLCVTHRSENWLPASELIPEFVFSSIGRSE